MVLCALQRAAWNGGEICWKCLENSRTCSPRRAPSIIGLAVSLCSLAATLSTHKSLLPNSALLLLCISLLPSSTLLHLPSSFFLCLPYISVSSLCLCSSAALLPPPVFSPALTLFSLSLFPPLFPCSFALTA